MTYTYLTHTIQDVAGARDLARKIVDKECPPSAQRQTPPEDWKETEEILYKRTNIPKPKKHKMAQAEVTVRGLDFDAMTTEAYRENLARVCQTGCVASQRVIRTLKDMQHTIELFGHSLRGLQDQVRQLRP